MIEHRTPLRPVNFALPAALSAYSHDRECQRASPFAPAPKGPAPSRVHVPHTHEPVGEPPPPSVQVPLEATALAPPPRSLIMATAHGKAQHCERVLEAMSAKSPCHPEFVRYMRTEARGGYRAEFALAEPNPTLCPPLFLVNWCEGQLLEGHDSSLRLVVPGKALPAPGVDK